MNYYRIAQVTRPHITYYMRFDKTKDTIVVVNDETGEIRIAGIYNWFCDNHAENIEKSVEQVYQTSQRMEIQANGDIYEFNGHELKRIDEKEFLTAAGII